MARYEASPFGRIRGKVGEAVGEYWKGVKYMKSYAVPTDRKSQKQLNVRWLWFILGSMYGLYHSRLKENPLSGMQNLPLLELEYQDFLQTAIRRCQNSIEHINDLTFNESSIDFSTGSIEGDDFTETDGQTPTYKMFLDDGFDDTECTPVAGEMKETLIYFDVANKQTWCFAQGDGLTLVEPEYYGMYYNAHGEPYTAEVNNLTFAFALRDCTAKLNSNGKTVRRWGYAFRRYNEIWFS